MHLFVVAYFNKHSVYTRRDLRGNCRWIITENEVTGYNRPQLYSKFL